MVVRRVLLLYALWVLAGPPVVSTAVSDPSSAHWRQLVAAVLWCLIGAVPLWVALRRVARRRPPGQR